jgi:hypothetical protein
VYRHPDVTTVSQVSSTPVDVCGLTWMFSHVAPLRQTLVDAQQRSKSTSQAEYAGSIPVIGSTSTSAYAVRICSTGGAGPVTVPYAAT